MAFVNEAFADAALSAAVALLRERAPRGALPAREREMVATVVAAANRCFY